MDSTTNVSKKEQNKRVKKHLPKLIHENALKDTEFAKTRQFISLLMNIWIIARIVLVVDDIIVITSLGGDVSSISSDISAMVIIILFAEAFKKGSRKLAILPIIGVAASIGLAGVDNLMLMLQLGYMPYTIYVIVFLANLAWQAFCMFYILFSGAFKAYEKEILRLTEEAKGLDLAA